MDTAALVCVAVVTLLRAEDEIVLLTDKGRLAERQCRLGLENVRDKEIR